MRNNVAVHRVVKNVKQRGQYIEPHSHTFFHYGNTAQKRCGIKVSVVKYRHGCAGSVRVV